MVATSFQFADADVIYAEIGLPSTEYADTIERFTFFGDLEKKGMVKREHRTMGSADSYRPTLASAIVVTEPNPLPGAGRAGLIDWSVPTPGFDAVESGNLAKVKLLAATTDADLSDVGLRCRRILVETMQAVYGTEMVPEGVKPPSPQDADEMLGHFLASRLPGKDHEAYRQFIRGAWALASARVHADRTGRAAAFAASQGTISFVRAIQMIERERPPRHEPRIACPQARPLPPGVCRDLRLSRDLAAAPFEDLASIAATSRRLVTDLSALARAGSPRRRCRRKKSARSSGSACCRPATCPNQ